MQLICKHDPHDPDHLICETKHSPTYEWLRSRWRAFYCVGPTCPPHRAYTHLVVDVILAIIVLGLLVSNVIIFSRVRRVPEALPTLEEKIEQVAEIPPPFPSEPVLKESEERTPTFTLDAEVIYFSPSGEQLGRGPWPPKVGETTRLKVALKILEIDHGETGSVSPSSGYQGLSVSGRLAPGIAWTGFVPIGGSDISFELNTRTIRFKPTQDGIAVFEIAVTSTEAQMSAGRILVLQELRLRVTDLKTGVVSDTAFSDVWVDVGE